eukprot:9548604-Alexandrium_andersonii.AAC.1
MEAYSRGQATREQGAIASYRRGPEADPRTNRGGKRCKHDDQLAEKRHPGQGRPDQAPQRHCRKAEKTSGDGEARIVEASLGPIEGKPKLERRG